MWKRKGAYRNTIRVLLADTLGLSLALLEGMLVLELGSHGDESSNRLGST